MTPPPDLAPCQVCGTPFDTGRRTATDSVCAGCLHRITFRPDGSVFDGVHPVPPGTERRANCRSTDGDKLMGRIE